MPKKFTDWFGMTAIPFDKNIEQLFVYPQVEELHQILELTIESRTAALVTGQAGTGKTTAVRVFLDRLPANKYRVVYLGYDQKGSSMFARLALELGLHLSPHSGRQLQLTQFIRRNIAGTSRELVLVVDEAHLLEGKTLEDIRLLTNSDMDRRSDVILIMLGQLWLRTKLKGHEALYQRLRFRYGLEGLSQKQAEDYIRHHLALVGCRKEIFTNAALGYLFFASGGILREINNLCVDSLLKASNQGLEKIDEPLVRLVIAQRDSA